MSWEFYFDHWLKLSQDDPHGFFAERSRATSSAGADRVRSGCAAG